MDYTKILNTDKVANNIKEIDELVRLAGTLAEASKEEEETAVRFALLSTAGDFLRKAADLQIENNRMLKRDTIKLNVLNFILKPILR